MKSLLFLTVIFLTGCSEGFKAGKILQKDKGKLAEQILQAECVRQIGDAKDILKYSPEKNLVYLILENGVNGPDHTLRPNEFVTIARQYNIRKLALKAVNVAVKDVANSGKNGITSAMTLSYTVTEESDACSGIAVSGMYRGNGQDDFIVELESALPPKELDYSFIIHKQYPAKTWLVTKTFNLACRSGKWSPVDAGPKEIESNLLNVCDDSERNRRLEQYFKSKNIVFVHGIGILRKDFPFFQKLKAGNRHEKKQ